jgi:hypothetical protein
LATPAISSFLFLHALLPSLEGFDLFFAKSHVCPSLGLCLINSIERLFHQGRFPLIFFILLVVRIVIVMAIARRAILFISRVVSPLIATHDASFSIP